MRYLLLFIIPFLWSGCRNDEPILFELEFREDFEITAGLNTIETHHFLLRNINTNLDSYLSSFGYQESDISLINPNNATLEVLFGNSDLDFVFEVSVRAYKENPLDYQEIFYRENVPLNTSSVLQLLPTLVDVKKLMQEDVFNIDVAFLFRNAPPQFIDARLTLDLLAK